MATQEGTNSSHRVAAALLLKAMQDCLHLRHAIDDVLQLHQSSCAICMAYGEICITSIDIEPTALVDDRAYDTTDSFDEEWNEYITQANEFHSDTGP